MTSSRSSTATKCLTMKMPSCESSDMSIFNLIFKFYSHHILIHHHQYSIDEINQNFAGLPSFLFNFKTQLNDFSMKRDFEFEINMHSMKRALNIQWINIHKWNSTFIIENSTFKMVHTSNSTLLGRFQMKNITLTYGNSIWMNKCLFLNHQHECKNE